MLERAAQAGSWTSAAALGARARDGHERPRSLADAVRWFTIASRQGGAPARESTRLDLDRCRRDRTAEEQSRELDAADTWLVDHPHADRFLFSGAEPEQFPVEEVYAAGGGGQ